MPLYEIKAPDGRTYEIEGPVGATQRQVEAEVLRQFPMAGKTTQELEAAPRAPSTIKDIGLATGQGLAGGIQSLTNLFGVDNAASKALGNVQQSAFEALSPARKEEIARRQELQERAKGDLGKEISTGIGGFFEAPLQTGLQALASSVPIIAGGLLPGGQVAAGASLGARALAGARGATGIGGLMGVGGQKGQDYEAVKQALLAQGVDPMIAEQKAQEAAAYSLQNLPRQALAGGAGALEGAFGIEQALANAAKKVSKAKGAPSLDAPTFKQAVGTSVLGEAAPEAVQAGVGQVGTNIALNQAGIQTDLTEGLAGTVAHDALVGAVLGLAVSPAQMSNLQRSHQQAKANEQAEKQAQFDREREAANQKAEAERAVLQKQTDEIRQQMEQQQAIALPAPAEEIPAEEVQVDPLKNPLGNIRKNEVPFDIYKQIDDYRKQAGLPKLKEYSIEDFVDAMPGVNPKAEQALLDELITAKSGYAGEKYTAEDILNQAKRKKVETKTQGFADFLARTTGVNALEKMSQPQLHAAFKALANLPEATDLNILPEGTNARRFDDKQYARALKGVDMFLNELGAPADPKQVIDTIKEYTNLTEDSHAGAILDAAIKNGDVDLIKSARYEVYDPKTGNALPSTYASKTAAQAAAAKRGLNVRQITTDAIGAPTTSATLPEGFDIREGAFKEGEAPAGYEVSAGEEVLFKANTIEEANAKKASFERTRAGMANARENQITQLNNAVEASQKRLNTLEAQGKGQTTQYEKAAGRHAKLVEETQAKIAALTEEIAKYDPKATPLEVKPTGTKAVGRKGYTVFEQGQARATYPTRQAAEEGILADMDEKQLQELSQQQGRRAIGKKAEAEIKRRTAAPQTEGKKVSEVLEDIETKKAKAQEKPETPGAKDRMAQFEALLGPMLKKFGLEDVGLKIVEDLKAEGSYAKKVIQIALDLGDPVRVLRHESIHALKELGFFTPQQWKALERMAKDQWIDKYLKNRQAMYNGQPMSRYDAYVKEYKGDMDKVTEEAIADAFADFANNKAPAGMLAALLKRLNDFFTALRNALAGAGFQTFEDVFGKVERGELKAGQAQGGAERLSVKEYQEEMKKAKAYEEQNGIMPYVPEPIDGVSTDAPRYSLQSYNPDKHLSYDATLGVPINKDGTITVYYHTTKENALRIAQNRMIPANGKERIYLTNESGGDAILNDRGNFDQDLDGSTVLVYVTPDKLQVDEQYENGRRDFFIPLTEGDFFTKKMKMQSIQKSRKTPITEEFSYEDHEERIAKAIADYKAATPADRRKLISNARKLLKKEHNVGSLLTENGKLEKTRIGDYNISYDGYSVASQGLGLASAQKITEKVNTCPRSAICEGLCLGETSGGNFMFGGAAQEDVGDIEKSAFRAGARMMQYLKTEALIINPEAFATLLQGEIDSLAKWCASPTQIKVNPETKKRMNVEKELYAPAIRLNVTSDFKPSMFRGLIEGNPDVMFYDYTKLGSEPIADNHHLTYSSTGFGQMVDGKKVFFKDKKTGRYDHNWATMRERLKNGQNVAMAFSSKSGLPKFLVDTETGLEFQVLDGDDYDARFLDEKSAVKESSGGKGVIVGLRNKAGNMSEKNATVKTGGFFVQYDPKTDGDTVVVPNQMPFKLAKAEPEERLSLRAAPDSKEFKQWFGDSKIVDEDGNPKVMYHGTYQPTEAGGIAIPRTRGNRNAFFVTPDPNFAAKYALNDLDWFPEKQGFGPAQEGAAVYPVYISAKNPFDYENSSHVLKINTQFKEVLKEEEGFNRGQIEELIDDLREGKWSAIEWANDYDLFEKNGFDAFYAKEQGRKNLGVFEPTQIKSATGNIGTYDQYNPDIRYSLREFTDTPEFKAWFGDSKIVTKPTAKMVDGKLVVGPPQPKVMYHGTARDITTFKPKQANAIFVTASPSFAEDFTSAGMNFIGREYWNTLDVDEQNKMVSDAIDAARKAKDITPAQAKLLKSRIDPNYGYAWSSIPGEVSEYVIKAVNDKLPTGPNIMPVYVKAEDPFDYNDPAHVRDVIKELQKSYNFSDDPEIEYQIKRGVWETIESQVVQDAIKRLGHDGFYVSEGGTKNLAVYSPSQIKSATGNVGTYDPNNPDIRYSLRDATDRFDPAEIEKASEQGYKSKNKLVNMDIADFLKLAKFGFNKEKEILAQKREQEGLKFTSIPYLYMSKDGNNLRVTGHEGRHRARALQAAGYTTMPVEWRTDIRWSEQTDPEKFDYSEFWPERIVAEEGALREGASIPMPFTREQGAQDYAGPQKQERLSLRDSTDPAIRGRVDETTTSREETGFVERITKALGGESFSKLRAQALNRYQRLADYDKELAKTMGGAAFMADASAESAALMSDLAAGVTASAMGVHDRNGGIPVYKNGFTTVFNDNGKIKGPVAIFAPLAKYNDPFVYQLYQFWAGAQRGSRLLADGKEELFTQADLQKAKQLEAQYPEFKEIQADWNEFNNGLVQFLVDTGVLSEAQKEAFTKHSDYIPFYRQMDGENTIGPNIFQSISGVKAPKKIKGGEAPLADFLETIVRNTQSSIQMGMKNAAAQRAVNVAVKINQAERLAKPSAGLDIVQVLENGNMVSYQVHDPLFIDAVKSLNMPELPFIGLLSGPANLLRNLVTKDPGFMMANMVRDSMAAYVTSGVKMTPVVDTIKNFKSAMAGTSPEFQALLNAGLLGGYEFSQNIEISAKAFEDELKKKAGGKSLLQRMANPKTAASSLWEALEKGTTASDAATRIEVYKRTLAETGNEAEALFRALEVMNFNRKGSSPVVRILTAAIPFLNARMQGLDVLYRASFGKLGHKDAAAIQRSFFVRGMTMAALSAMYWAMTHDDDEYKKQEQETKDNNWLVPSLGVKIPIPFEVGVIFKVIPERIMALSFGDDTGKDFMKSMARQLSSTLAVNPIPQAALPLVEATTNYSFFTQRPIIGQGMEGIAPEYQVGPNTSAVAAQIGSSLGISPMKLDHIIGGYTGTMGMYMVSALDSIMGMNGDSPNASKRFEQMPVIKRFALDPEARGTVTSYYELKNATDQAVRTSNLLERTMNFEERGEFMRDNIKMLASKEYILDLEKTMKEFRQMQVMIRSSKMDADAKRDALLRINQAQNALTANINTLKANVS